MSRTGKLRVAHFLSVRRRSPEAWRSATYAYKRTPANPLLYELGAGEAALTPYVRVDQSGVTIITPRADLGQGAYSVQAALVAEELDLDWNDIKVDPGPPGTAYYNTRVLAEGFPIAATDDGYDGPRHAGCGRRRRQVSEHANHRRLLNGARRL